MVQVASWGIGVMDTLAGRLFVCNMCGSLICDVRCLDPKGSYDMPGIKYFRDWQLLLLVAVEIVFVLLPGPLMTLSAAILMDVPGGKYY
jgi:hypothetical protein